MVHGVPARVMIRKVTSDRDLKHDRPDSVTDMGPVEHVEITPDYRAELSVPLTSAQLAAIDRIAQDRGISAAEVVQQLIEQALMQRARR
jgi:hypothetical protein